MSFLCDSPAGAQSAASAFEAGSRRARRRMRGHAGRALNDLRMRPARSRRIGVFIDPAAGILSLVLHHGVELLPTPVAALPMEGRPGPADAASSETRLVMAFSFGSRHKTDAAGLECSQQFGLDLLEQNPGQLAIGHARQVAGTREAQIRTRPRKSVGLG